VLHGRDAERDTIGALLEGARSARSAALVIRGEAGVGKSALLADTADRAEDMHVLRARGVESESDLPFAAVQGLLRPALDRLDALPAPQARALGTALGLAEGPPPERFLVYSACLGLLAELAERRPVLCLVDDAHWLDSASAEALTFVARRLGAEGVVLLFGAREGDERRFAADGVPSLEVGGLDEAAARAVLAGTAGDVAPDVVERLVARTGGNALALVELPGALTAGQRSGAEPLPAALPMTRELEAVFSRRVAGLSADAAAMLLVAAVDDSESLAVVTRAAARLGIPDDALDEAERAGLVAAHGTRLAFRHPLVRSAIHAAASSGARRDAHRALADTLEGDGAEADRRAWHLAAAAIRFDPEVVRELERAADRAEERGGHASAALALERAADLTEDPSGRAALLVRAARGMSAAGRDAAALALAARAGEPLAPALRAEVARVRGMAAVRQGRPADAYPELVAAADDVAVASPATAVDLVMHAAIAGWQSGGPGSAFEGAAVLAAIDPAALDPDSRAVTRMFRGFVGLVTGDAATGAPLLEEAVAWGAGAEEARHAQWAAWAALWLGDAQRFEALLDRSAAIARERGELGLLADVLGSRAVHLALIAQRYRDASVAAEEALGLVRELDAANVRLLPLAALASVAAVHGDVESARRHADEALALAQDRGLALRASAAVHALALTDMAEGRWDEALAGLERLSHPADPIVGIVAADLVEAAVRAGRRERAAAALEAYETWARLSGTPTTAPRLASCRGLVAEGDDATRHLDEAAAGAGAAPPFDRARIHLLHGEHLRRMGRRVDARAALRAALDGFEEIGAEPWAERARGELRASGETARRRGPDATATLTAQERQIAAMVGQGLTNKEVAAQLYLSPRTIDAHLRNVFGKLGISSRRELRDRARGGPAPATVGG
jgi:DNA-binding CsgD family transcriptional regulator